jgi:hypothetical protein
MTESFAERFVEFVRSTPGICERAESLCRSLSPEEFANEPIYVSLQSDFPEELLAVGHCFGWAAANFGDRLRGRRGYRGPGHRIVLCDTEFGRLCEQSLREGAQQLASDAGSAPDAPTPEELFPFMAKQYLNRILGPTLLHEFVHVVEFGRPREGAPRSDQEIADLNRADASWFNVELPKKSKRYPWDLHGPPFVRGQLHLKYRLEAAGGDLRDFDSRLGAWETLRYELSPMSDYATALGDEPERMFDRPLREILASDPPFEFAVQFCQDVLDFEAKRDAAAGI